MNEETLLAIVHTIVRIVEVAGIAVILTGAATTSVIFAWRLRNKPIDQLMRISGPGWAGPSCSGWNY